MLGKLMKYEFKATARIFLPLFGALLFMSIVSRLFSGLQTKTPQIISITLSSMLIAAAFALTLALTIQRFYKNLMTDEGYLMHTLPVSTDKLIWSKLIVAAIWTVVCAVVVFLSITIMALSKGEFREFLRSLSEIGIPSLNQALFMLEFCLIVLAGIASGILCIYACMALSMFFDKHRVAISFAIFIGITTLLQILAAILISLPIRGLLGDLIGYSYQTGEIARNSLYAYFQTHSMLALHMGAVLVLLVIAAFGAVFFAVTRTMLKKRLNLQ